MLLPCSEDTILGMNQTWEVGEEVFGGYVARQGSIEASIVLVDGVMSRPEIDTILSHHTIHLRRMSLYQVSMRHNPREDLCEVIMH